MNGTGLERAGTDQAHRSVQAATEHLRAALHRLAEAAPVEAVLAAYRDAAAGLRADQAQLEHRTGHSPTAHGGRAQCRLPLPGSLAPYLAAGHFQSGDELTLTQPRKHQTFRAIIDAAGRIVLADGRAFTSPTGAGRACTGLAIGWQAWVHTPTGRTIGWWRDRYRPAPIAAWTEQLTALLRSLPRGAWTTCTDLAGLTGTTAGAIGRFLHDRPDTVGAYRVLSANGMPRRSEYTRGRTAPDRLARLREDGIRVDEHGIADTAQRLTGNQLWALTERT